MKNNYNDNRKNIANAEPVLPPPAKRKHAGGIVSKCSPEQAKRALDVVRAEICRLELCKNRSMDSDQCFGCPAVHDSEYTLAALATAANALRGVVGDKV